MKKAEYELARDIVKKSAETWPTLYVVRKAIDKFSGGLLHPRTMANFDSLGTGPKGAFRIGKQIAYPVSSVVDWLVERIEKR